MQHAWFFALLALPAARAVACECDEWRNGATAEDPALCRKGEGGLWMCYPANNMDGSCPGDQLPCTQGEDEGAPSSGQASGPLAKLSDKLRTGGSSKKLAVLPDNLVSNKV